MPKESIPRSKSGRIMDYLANRSNIGRPIRAIKNLMDDPPSLTGPIRREDVERSFDAAGFATAGSVAGKRPRNSVGTGGRQYKVSGAQSQVQVNQPKPGSSKFVGPVKPKATRKSSGSSSSEAPASKQSSARYSVSGAQQGYTGPKPKPGSAKFIGPTRATQPGEKGFIGPTRPPRSGDKDFVGPRQPPRSGDKDFIGPVRTPRSGDKDFVGPVRPSPEKKGSSMARNAAIAGGGAGAAAGGYYSAGSKKEDRKTLDSRSSEGKTKIAVRREYPGTNTSNRKQYGGARPETPGSYPAKSKVYGGARPETPGSYQAVRKKAAASGSASAPEIKAGAATDKSRAAGKMTAFQRQKARQFEKEGVAGRSMTRAQAQRKASEKTGSSRRKPEAPKGAKRTGPLKSAFAQISFQGRKKK